MAKGLHHYHRLDVNDPDNDQALRSVYDNWATHYDRDNDHTLGTVSQPKTVEILSQVIGTDSSILDAGCGTGLVGHELSKLGFKSFEGIDISNEMLQHAAARGYSHLYQLSLNEPLPLPDNRYDAVISAGLFTHGHVKCHALLEFVRITKPGGYICFTVNEGVYQCLGFDQEIKNIEKAGMWTIKKLHLEPYMTKEGVNAFYCLAKVC